MLAIGTVVGASRWPFFCSHPDCWEKPLKGTVIRDRKLEELHKEGAATDLIAVRWSFGKVYWEPIAAVRPYAEDVSAWETARKDARESESKRLLSHLKK